MGRGRESQKGKWECLGLRFACQCSPWTTALVSPILFRLSVDDPDFSVMDCSSRSASPLLVPSFILSNTIGTRQCVYYLYWVLEWPKKIMVQKGRAYELDWQIPPSAAGDYGPRQHVGFWPLHQNSCSCSCISSFLHSFLHYQQSFLAVPPASDDPPPLYPPIPVPLHPGVRLHSAHPPLTALLVTNFFQVQWLKEQDGHPLWMTEHAF